MTAPLLVLGWGNLSRGDDALGPLFLARLRHRAEAAGLAGIEFIEDYQLQVEHALDLIGRDQVLFVDASRQAAAPFELSVVRAARDAGFTSHALSPAAVLQAWTAIADTAPPPCLLLAISARQFELGQAPGPEALDHLARALDWGLAWLIEQQAGLRDRASSGMVRER